jgi:hypothetical protein
LPLYIPHLFGDGSYRTAAFFISKELLMNELPNTKLYKECPNPKCGAWSFGQYDVYCPRCGTKLKDSDKWLASIADYAKSLLIEFLEYNSELAMQADINEIPAYATEYIRTNGNVMFNQYAIRHVLAECWNEVETALQDWRENNGTDYPVRNIEDLHVFAVSQHAEITWRKVMNDYCGNHLDEEGIAEAVVRLAN